MPNIVIEISYIEICFSVNRFLIYIFNTATSMLFKLL